MAGAKQVRIIYAGPIIIYILCDRRSGREQPRERAAKRNASNAATKQRNLVMSRDKLELMIAANFPTPRSGLVLTMSFDEKTMRKIKKHRRPSKQRALVRYYINEFRKALRKERAAAGLPRPRDITSIEILTSENQRWHVHSIIDSTGDDLPLVRRAWKWGENIEARPLRVDSEKNHQTLARYMSKESRGLQDHESKPGTHVWSYSLNCLKPEVVSKTVSSDFKPDIPRGAVILEDERRDNEFSSYRYTKIRCCAEAFPKPPRAHRGHD